MPKAAAGMETKRRMPVAVLVVLRIDARAMQPLAVLLEALCVKVLCQCLHDTRIEIVIAGWKIRRWPPFRLLRWLRLWFEGFNPGHQIGQVRYTEMSSASDGIRLAGIGMMLGGATI